MNEDRTMTDGQDEIAGQVPFDGQDDAGQVPADAETGAQAGGDKAAGYDAVLDDGQVIAEVEIVVDEGALRVHGGDGGVRVRGRGDAPTVQRDGERVRVHARRGGDVEVPRGARLVFGALPAALSVRGVHGAIDGQRVDGDARLADVGAVTLGAIGRMLDVEGVAGTLDVATVGGHVRVAGVGGNAMLENVGGAARLADIAGDLAVTAGGSVKVALTPRPGGSYRVTAGGSIRWLSPEALNASVSAVAGGRVRIDVPGARDASDGHGARYQAVLGEGGATMELAAGGSVRVGSGSGHEGWESGFDGEPVGDMAERFGFQVEGIAELISARIDESIGGLPEALAQRGLSGDQIERIAERLQHAGERAAEQVERKLRRMSEKAERLSERAERMAEHGVRHGLRGGPWTMRPAGPGAPEPPRAPVRQPAQTAAGAGSEEVMIILRMVEGGKISAEEAERLITALGGRG